MKKINKTKKNAFNVIYEFATEKKFHSCFKIKILTFLWIICLTAKNANLKKNKMFQGIVGKVKNIKLDRQKLKENIWNQNQK